MLLLLDFSPLCVFICLLKLPAWEDAKLHWLHLFDFSPLWVLKCVLKWLTRENAESHWLHLFDFSLPSVPLIGISLAVFLPKSRCSRFRSISRSVLALAIFVSNWYVKRLHLIWIGRIETESEFHQYFLNSMNQHFLWKFEKSFQSGNPHGSFEESTIWIAQIYLIIIIITIITQSLLWSQKLFNVRENLLCSWLQFQPQQTK